MAEIKMKDFRSILEQAQQQNYAANFEDPDASRQNKVIKNSLRKKRADVNRALEYDRGQFVQHILTRMDVLAPKIGKKLYEVTVGDLVALFDRGMDYVRIHTANEEFQREYSEYGHKFITYFYAIKRGKLLPDDQNPFIFKQ